MKYPAILLLLAFVACSLLPDRVYTEVGHAPLAALHPELGEFAPYEFTVGLEWALQPTDVIILGQRDAHPWDFASSLGIYDGQTPNVPAPLLVADDALMARLAILAGRVDVVAEDVAAAQEDTSAITLGLAEDLEAVRETSDLLKSILLWITGVGGTALASIFGVRGIRARRNTTPGTEE